MKFPILYLNNFLKLNKKYTQRKNFPFLSWNGKKGDNITIQQVGTGNDLIFNAGCCGGFSITNPWGNVSTNGTTTTTTTDDTTDKSGGDDAEPCHDPDAPFENCMANCYNGKTGRDGWDWRKDLDKINEISAITCELTNRQVDLLWAIFSNVIIIFLGWLEILELGAQIFIGISKTIFDAYVAGLKSKSTKELKDRREEMVKKDPWLKDGWYCDKLLHAISDCYDECEHYLPPDSIGI